MSIKYKTLSLAIIAVLVWYFFQQKENLTTTVNVVSLQNTVFNEVELSEKVNKPPTKKTENEPLQIEFYKNNLSKNRIKEYGYIDLYHMLLLSYECLAIYSAESSGNSVEKNSNIKEEYDHVQKYQENISFNSNNRQNHVAPLQLERFKDYVNQCQSLKSEIIEVLGEHKKNNSYYFLSEAIQDLMLNTKAKTDEEIKLKEVFRIGVVLKNSMDTLGVLKKGKETLNEQQINDVEHEIRRLNDILTGSKFFSQESKETTEYIDVKREYDNEKAYLASTRIVDKEKIRTQKLNLFRTLNNLQKNLNSHYPSVFLQSFFLLNFGNTNKLPVEYKIKEILKIDADIPILSQSIYKELQMKNKIYFNMILEPAVNLYLCYLGEPCDSQLNRTLKKICFIPKSGFWSEDAGIYFEACELNLEDFYFQHFLTENQVEDMNIIFNYMVNVYAK